MKHLTLALCFIAAISASASVEVFYRDEDYITWVLNFEGTEFEITMFKSGTECSRTKGRIVKESAQIVVCENSRLSEQPSIVHGKRLHRMCYEGIQYLVEESRLAAFGKATKSKDEFFRNLELTNFFHHGPVQMAKRGEPNQSSTAQRP